MTNTKQVKWNGSKLRPEDDPDRWPIDWLSEVTSKCGRFRLRRWDASYGGGSQWQVQLRSDTDKEFDTSRFCQYDTLKAAKQRCQWLSDQWANPNGITVRVPRKKTLRKAKRKRRQNASN